MEPIKREISQYVLPVVSGAIVLSLGASAFELWEASSPTIGAFPATCSVAAPFLFAALIIHFCRNYLSHSARVLLIAGTYLCKFAKSFALAVSVNAGTICAAAGNSGSASDCASLLPGSTLSTALVTMLENHSMHIMVPVVTSLFFLVLGDLLALTLDFLHNCIAGGGHA